MKPILLLIIVTILCTESYAQSYKPKSVAKPEIASLAKFGDIPVGYYTGIPDISIPLYTIKVGNVEVPILLRYHSSGIQVEQEATWVGLGWDLNVGGTITQKITGVLDSYNDYVNTYNQFYNNILNHGISYPGIDTNFINRDFCFTSPDNTGGLNAVSLLRTYNWGQPNTYSLSLPKGSAEFYLDPITHVPKQIGNKNSQYFITRNQILSTVKTDWDVKDVQGNTYYFGSNDIEYSEDNNSTNYFNSIDFKLSYIQLPNGKKINFNYVDGNYQISTYSQYASYFGSSSGGNPGVNVHPSTFHTKYLNIIETEHEKIIFELSSTAAEREDLKGEIVGNVNGAKRLKAIHIWDKFTNTKVKSYEFTYDYFIADENFPAYYPTSSNELKKRLKLVSLREVGYKPDGTPVYNPAHSFEYNELHPLPRKDAYARDHWGLFNGRNNTSLLPNMTSDISSGIFYQSAPLGIRDDAVVFIKNLGNANRGMDPQYALSGILTKVKYPTGGYSSFSYEPNNFRNYRVFSASEMESGEGYIQKNVVDYNFSPDPVNSDPIYLSADGTKTIYNLNIGFARIDQSIDHSSLLGSSVTIWKVSPAGSKTSFMHWDIISDRNIFNQTGSYSINLGRVVLSGATGDYFIVETYLPNKPELTPTGSTIPKASVGCTFSLSDDVSLAKESIGGGFRIATMENYTVTGTLAEKKSYAYINTSLNKTSGKLMATPRYYAYYPQTKFQLINSPDGSTPPTYIPVPVITIDFASFSYSPLSPDAQGSIIGYNEVNESQRNNSDSNGKTTYYFRNNKSTVQGNQFGSLAKTLPNIMRYDNGLVDSISYFNNRNTIIKKVKNSYSLIEDKLSRGFGFYDLISGAGSDAVCNDPTYPYNQSRWLAVLYPITTKWFVPSSVKEIEYLNGNTFTKEKYMTYNSLGQVIKDQLVNSKKDTVSNFYKFPNDSTSSDNILQAIKSKKLFSHILKQTSLVGTKLNVRKDFGYSLNPNGNVNLNKVRTSYGNNPAFDEVSDIKYDLNDNIISFNENGKITSYQWGYNNRYQTAVAENAKFYSSTTGTTTSSALLTVPKGSTSQNYTKSFNVGASGTGSITVGFSGAPVANEVARISGTITSNSGYQQNFDLCLGTASNGCGGTSNVLQLTGMTPGAYTLNAVMYFQSNLANGRTLTVSYPDATYSGPESYYENFEENSSATIGAAHTGSKFINGASFTVDKVMAAGRSYKISYWLRSSGKWKYSGEVDYTGPYILSGGDAYDDICIFPADSQMSTYTYLPSIGATSHTDARGQTTYYDYDEFLRLKNVKDQDQYIIKNTTYHYKP